MVYHRILNVVPCAVQWSESESPSVVSDSLRPHGLYSPWNSPGQNTGVGSRSLLQEIFPTQGSNPGLPQCGRILLPPEPPYGRTLFIHSIYILVCLCWSQTPHPSLPHPLPPWQPEVCYSLCLGVCFCSIDMFIYVMFSIPHISDIIWHLSFSGLLLLVCRIINSYTKRKLNRRLLSSLLALCPRRCSIC